jgi:hypothetical protein
MTAGDEDSESLSRELAKEFSQGFFFRFAENCKAWQRRAEATIERWWDSPYATTARAEFGLLSLGVFLQPVRRVGNDGMNGVWVARFHPSERVPKMDLVADLLLLKISASVPPHRPRRPPLRPLSPREET